jgi:hypothetical protein
MEIAKKNARDFKRKIKIMEMESAERRVKMETKLKLWVEEVIPNWEKLWKQAESFRSGSVWNMFQRRPMLDIYIADGVPPNKRGEVWIRLISINEVLHIADVGLYDVQMTKRCCIAFLTGADLCGGVSENGSRFGSTLQKQTPIKGQRYERVLRY